MSCNKTVEWYKSVKETQGSVEVTSFGQMNNILKYGYYTVGASQSRTVQTIHDVIHLTLKERDKPLHKKSYSLDELRDLESKLVLITGNKTENKRDVDRFLDVSRCLWSSVCYLCSRSECNGMMRFSNLEYPFPSLHYRLFTVCVGLQKSSLASSKWAM